MSVMVCDARASKKWHGDYYWNDYEIVGWYNDFKKSNTQKAKFKEVLISIVWHSTRMQDWWMPEDGREKIETMLPW